MLILPCTPPFVCPSNLSVVYIWRIAWWRFETGCWSNHCRSPFFLSARRVGFQIPPQTQAWHLIVDSGYTKGSFQPTNFRKKEGIHHQTHFDHWATTQAIKVSENLIKIGQVGAKWDKSCM